MRLEDKQQLTKINAWNRLSNWAKNTRIRARCDALGVSRPVPEMFQERRRGRPPHREGAWDLIGAYRSRGTPTAAAPRS